MIKLYSRRLILTKNRSSRRRLKNLRKTVFIFSELRLDIREWRQPIIRVAIVHLVNLLSICMNSLDGFWSTRIKSIHFYTVRTRDVISWKVCVQLNPKTIAKHLKSYVHRTTRVLECANQTCWLRAVIYNFQFKIQIARILGIRTRMKSSILGEWSHRIVLAFKLKFLSNIKDGLLLINRLELIVSRWNVNKKVRMQHHWVQGMMLMRNHRLRLKF